MANCRKVDLIKLDVFPSFFFQFVLVLEVVASENQNISAVLVMDAPARRAPTIFIVLKSLKLRINVNI